VLGTSGAVGGNISLLSNNTINDYAVTFWAAGGSGAGGKIALSSVAGGVNLYSQGTNNGINATSSSSFGGNVSISGFSGVQLVRDPCCGGTAAGMSINVTGGGTGGLVNIYSASGAFTMVDSTSISANSTANPGFGGQVRISTPVGLAQVSLGNSSAGSGKTFSLVTTADGAGNGRITIAGTLQSAVGQLGTITLNSTESGAGLGGIVEASGALRATTINLADGTNGLGTADIGTSTGSFLTIASNLTVNTTGDVYVNNTGSVSLGSSSAGNGKTFSLITTADAAGKGRITLAGNLQSAIGIIGTINLNSTESGSGTGGIIETAGAISATTIKLADGNNGLGNADIGSSGSNFLTVTANLTANTTGNVYINNTGSVTLGNSSAGNGKTFSLVTTADGSGNGRITLAGTLAAASGTLSLINLNSTESGSGTGGIVEASGGLTATTIRLADGTNGLGTADIGAPAGNFLTTASNLTANTTGNVYINNTGSVSLGNSSAGNGKAFSLTTTADGSGNGRITLNGTLQSTTGLIGTITLNSTESGAGAGGIVENAGAVKATTVNLIDGTNGAGTANIGTSSASFLTIASNLTANTTGDVYINNTGAVVLGNSSAGNGKTFSLQTTADAVTGNGSITLAGNLKSSSGIINTITLNSTESGAGAGGILENSGAITATNVNLSDGTNGAGNADIGSSTQNFLTVASNLTANTTGNVFINNTGAVNLGASSAGNTFKLTNTAAITVAALVTAPNLTLTTRAGNVDVNVAPATVTSLTITAGADITQAAGVTFTAPTMVLQAGGFVGTAGAHIRTVAGTL
jgi:hypothetical protein